VHRYSVVNVFNVLVVSLRLEKHAENKQDEGNRTTYEKGFEVLILCARKLTIGLRMTRIQAVLQVDITRSHDGVS
jgi:hypothetical protein